jgi:UDP-N-acetyl-D-mannosaminuronic acid dehydrogenase
MKTVVSVIGVGRIGLPIALVTATKVNHVYGVDVNPILIEELKLGRIRLSEPGLRELLDSCKDKFEPTMDLKGALLRSSVILFCVGTRRFAQNRPNLQVLWKIIKDLARAEIKGRLIVLKTTVPIGTTRELGNYLEKTTGLRADRDFYLAFSPERTLEGKAVEELQKLPVIVGANGKESLQRAVRFYKSTGVDVVGVGSAQAAELIKLVDNAYRITKFAFSNDIALIAERMGVNAFDVIEAANYRYPRNDISYPTCGVSGYCLTKDPYYLEEAFKQVRKDRGFSSIWMYGRKSCDYRVSRVVAQVEQSLKKEGIRIGKSRALICGITYKSNIDDIRDSHGMVIARELAKRGSQVSVWDPWITVPLNEFPVQKDPTSAFKGKDVAVFTVAHRQFLEIADTIGRLTNQMRTPLIYDGAGIFRYHRRTRDSSYSLIGTGYPDDFGRQTHRVSKG